MIVKTGNMWETSYMADLVCFTSNATIDRNGNLVMGAGSALAAANMWPVLPGLFGQAIAPMSCYGLAVQAMDGFQIGAFQTKRHYAERSDLSLIHFAVERLRGYIDQHPEIEVVYLPFPGVGYGMLQIYEVFPLLAKLDHRVVVWLADNFKPAKVELWRPASKEIKFFEENT